MYYWQQTTNLLSQITELSKDVINFASILQTILITLTVNNYANDLETKGFQILSIVGTQ